MDINIGSNIFFVINYSIAKNNLHLFEFIFAIEQELFEHLRNLT